MPIRFSLTGTGILTFLFRFLITGTGDFNLPSGSGLPETEFRFRSGFRPDIPVPVVHYSDMLIVTQSFTANAQTKQSSVRPEQCH